MTFATIDALRESLMDPRPKPSAAYADKQLHPVPKLDVVDRRAFLKELATGRHVVDVGASGPMAADLRAVAASYLGLDRTEGPDVVAVDLDAYDAALPPRPEADLVICGEVLEHLSNPGWLLTRLRRQYPVTTVITAPNAFSAGGLASLNRDIENVHREHVAYYSYHTLHELVRRHGYRLETAAWYNGHPKFAEGLIMVVQ